MNLTFSLLTLLVSNAFVSGFQEEAEIKTIKISKDSFSKIYPAVWFSPSDGATTPLVNKSEVPPKPHFKIWIEPRDPEITTMDAKAAKEGRQGFQLIGH